MVQFGRIVRDRLNRPHVTPSLRSRASSERSEGSVAISSEILRCAQDDTTRTKRKNSQTCRDRQRDPERSEG